MKEITSLVNPFIKQIMNLHDRKGREETKKFIIEGYHLVSEAHKADILEQLLIVDSEDKIDGVENFIVTYDVIKKITKTKNPQKIIGICRLLGNNQELSSRLLILDNISDPGNLGTLIRAALGFDFTGIIISNNSVDIYNDKVIRATQGAIFQIPIIKSDLNYMISELKQNNYYIYGTCLQGSKNLQSIEFKEPLGLILGNEANGINPSILNQTNYNIKIDINNKLESLNVAVAGGIIMHHINQKIV